MKNGALPEAPADGHSTQAGTLVEGAVVALPDEPPELAAPTAVGDEVFEDGPEVLLPMAELVGCGVVAIVPVVVVVLVFAPVVIAAGTVALLPSLTMPLFVTA